MISSAILKTGIRFVPSTEPLISNRRQWTTRLMSGLYALLAAAAFFTVGHWHTQRN
jgi:hypothetical protein